LHFHSGCYYVFLQTGLEGGFFCCQFVIFFLRSYGVSLDFLPERMVKAENLE